MESAKTSQVAPKLRPAAPADAPALTRLLRRTPYLHLHADWRLPADWLAHPAFFLREVGENLSGCLAITADPAPAAWVRIVALSATEPAAQMATLFAAAWPQLGPAGVCEVGWLIASDWVEPLLPVLPIPFRRERWVEAYEKPDLIIPAALPQPDIDIRPVVAGDMAALAAIEAEAYGPLWRHSADGLAAAWRQSLSFDVVWLGDRPVGFQYSTFGQTGAHLARISVDPDVQGCGIGSVLLAHAIAGYRARGLRRVTLNTQSDNRAAQALYDRFGFAPAGFRVPVWVAPVT